MHQAPAQFRQGDVFLVPIAGPAGVATSTEVPRDAGRVVLAYGEVTGHAHAIADDAATLWVDGDDVRRLVVEAEVFLRHEEHATIAVPPGAYEVRIQREYSPAGIVRVAD